MHFFTTSLPLALTLCVPPLQLFAIVVFATITAEGYINTPYQEETKCMFNGVDSACSYGVGIGVLAFLACVVFLVLDAYFPQISNAKERKYIVIGDLVFSGESQVSLLTRIKEMCPKTGSTAELWLILSSCFILILTFFFFSFFLLCCVFIMGQRLGHSCGSSASVSWPTSGHTLTLTSSLSLKMLPELSWPSPSSQSSPG